MIVYTRPTEYLGDICPRLILLSRRCGMPMAGAGGTGSLDGASRHLVSSELQKNRNNVKKDISQSCYIFIYSHVFLFLFSGRTPVLFYCKCFASLPPTKVFALCLVTSNNNACALLCNSQLPGRIHLMSKLMILAPFCLIDQL
jgi:hypothetical protein